MIVRLFLLGLRHPAMVTFSVFLITLFTAAGLPKLEIDTSFNSLIPPDEPARLVYQRVMGQFGSDNKTIIYVRDDDLWSPDKLAALEALQRKLKQIPHVTTVDSLFDLRTIEGRRDEVTGARQVNAEPVLADVPRTAVEAAQARAKALGNPLYVGNLFSQDGSVTAIIVTVADTDDEEDFSLQIFEQLEAAIAEQQGQFQEIFQVGPPRINAEIQTSLTDDFALLGPLSALVLVVSIIVFMKSVLASIVPLVTSALAIVWTFGLMGWMGVPLNILSAMIPSLIIVIGSTEDTHMMAAFFRGLLDGEKDGEDGNTVAIRYMARHTGLPLILTMATTALGFASNLFSSITLIQDFAISSTMAILFNGIITIAVVPVMLAFFGPMVKAPKAERPANKPTTGDEALVPDEELYGDNLVVQIIRTFRESQDRFPIFILFLTAILFTFFTYQASNLYVTNDPMSYFPEDRPLIQQTKRIHEDLAGIKVFFIALEAETEKAFLEPENLAKLDQIQQFMAKQGVFDTSISIADHLKYVNREFRGEFADLSLPQTRQLVAQYLMFFHRSELENYVSHDYRLANIVVRHNINDSHTLNRYITELKAAVSQISGPGMSIEVIGENLLVNEAAESLMVSQVKALGLLLGLIFVLMSIMFTSLKGGAIALIPALIPIALMFGIMGFLNIPLNPGTAMVAVIAVGLAIDGTIHLLARYNELCRSTSDYRAAVHAAVLEVATPLIVSSLALSLGFGILLFSNFTVVAQFGALAAATMLISIFANLLITPIIMSRIRLVGLYQIVAMKVDKAVLERSQLFAGMSNYQRRKAILISEFREFEEGELLVRQGDIGRNMYMILDGSAEVVRRDEGNERVLAQLEAGQIFGEVGYIRATERTADVRAIGKVSALRFDYERMQKDLKFFPNIVAQLNFNISAILGERLADVLDSQD